MTRDIPATKVRLLTFTIAAMILVTCSGRDGGSAVNTEGGGGGNGGGGTCATTTAAPGVTETSLCYAPSSLKGVPETAHWLHGAPVVVKDNQSGDLVGFFSSSVNDKHILQALVSADHGATWSWRYSDVDVDVPPPLVIAQSTDGYIHMLAWRYSDGGWYARVSLVRDGGHVTGFALETRFGFPYEGGVDCGADLVAGTDLDGTPALFWTVHYDTGNSLGSIIAGRSKPASRGLPAGPSDFVGLDNSETATLLAESFSFPHEAGVLMAQHPQSKDLWFQWGSMDVGHTVYGPAQYVNKFPVTRLRATPGQDGKFILGQSTIVAEFTALPDSRAHGVQNYSVLSTPQAIWFAYSALDGLRIDRVDKDGNLTNPIPSPYCVEKSGGVFALSVNANETTAWVAGMVSQNTSDTASAGKIWASHWDGTIWTEYPGGAPEESEPFRNSRSAGWDDGLVFIQNDMNHEGGGYGPSIPMFWTLHTAP